MNLIFTLTFMDKLQLITLNMKRLLLTLCSLSIVYIINAQDNNVKLNLLNATYGDLRLGYERVLNDNLTVQGNIGYLIPRKVPTAFFDEETIEAEYGGNIDLSSKITGYNVSLELRYYPGSKGAPRGFYLAPYFKHNNWNINVVSAFSYDISQADFENELTAGEQENATPIDPSDLSQGYTLSTSGTFNGKFKQTGGGLMLGYQWLVSDKISIDFNFFGLGIESDRVLLDLKTDAKNVDFQQWETEIQQGSEEFANFGVDIETDVRADGIGIKTSSFILPMPRFGFSIGYAF